MEITREELKKIIQDYNTFMEQKYSKLMAQYLSEVHTDVLLRDFLLDKFLDDFEMET